MKSPRRELVEELAATEVERAKAVTSGDLIRAADLWKAADAIRDRLFRMASEPEEHEDEWQVHITIADDPANERRELCNRAGLEKRWPWLHTLLWDGICPTEFLSMEFTIGLYHAEIKEIEK